MNISLIYARSINYCIGKDGRLPWNLPDDVRFFHETTAGKPVIMGRRTYEDHRDLLPGRLNIVVSRRPRYRVAHGVYLRGSLASALELAASDYDQAFVIGGAGLFPEAMPAASRVYETVVDVSVDGDTFVPRFDFTGWRSKLLHKHEVDDRHACAFSTFLHERS